MSMEPGNRARQREPYAELREPDRDTNPKLTQYEYYHYYHHYYYYYEHLATHAGRILGTHGASWAHAGRILGFLSAEWTQAGRILGTLGTC